MFRILATAGIAALMMTTSAMSEEKIPRVKSIEVDADLASVENKNAAAYWGQLSEDLKGAIATRVSTRTGDDGVLITVDISEVELSNGFQESLGLADTRLVGKVRVRNQKDPSRDKTYDLTIDVNQAKSLFPAGTDMATLPADTRVYYDAMVGAFADAVVKNLG